MRQQKEVMKNNGAWTYIGETVGGVFITESGLLAAAHLVGATSSKIFKSIRVRCSS